MTYLEQELTPAEIGDLSILEASSAAPLSNLPQRPGESYTSWGQRLQAGDAALASQQKAKGRSRKGASGRPFAQLHPRGRGGQWVAKQGAQGQEVRGIQSKVGVKVDGRYGNLTKAAVMRYQWTHGLQVDGRVGKQTVAMMRGRQRAAKVKAGPMSAADRRWLASLHA